MAYLRVSDAISAYLEGVAKGEIGKCPKCGSPNLEGLIPPDFESRRCTDCGKVSDQWRIREGISYAGLSGETDGGTPGPQGGSTHSGREEEPPISVPKRRDRKYQAFEYATPQPQTSGGEIFAPSSSLPWQRRKKIRVKERLMVPSYYAYRNADIGLPESVQVHEWMDDLLDDAHDLGYKYQKSTRTNDGQTVHVFAHPESGNTLHINDGPNPVDKHWMIRSKSGETIHQGSADSDQDWFLDRTGKLKPSTGPSRPLGGWQFRYESIQEESGFMTGYPTSPYQVGKILIRVLDNVNLSVMAPQQLIEQVEAYKFFEQFQILLPKSPMLNIRVMEKIANWWRNFAEPGDLLEIDCTTGLGSVTNRRKNTFYGLGSFGTIPDGTLG